MRDNLDDKFARKNLRDEERKKNPPVNDDEEEETYLYDIRKPMEFINESAGGVFDITKQTGLNSAKSVFDKGATFKTGQ